MQLMAVPDGSPAPSMRQDAGRVNHLAAASVTASGIVAVHRIT